MTCFDYLDPNLIVSQFPMLTELIAVLFPFQLERRQMMKLLFCYYYLRVLSANLYIIISLVLSLSIRVFHSMRSIVTGGVGFIGSHLCELL